MCLHLRTIDAFPYNSSCSDLISTKVCMTGLLRDDAGLLHPVLINVPANQIREIIEKAEDCGRQLEGGSALRRCRLCGCPERGSYIGTICSRTTMRGAGHRRRLMEGVRTLDDRAGALSCNSRLVGRPAKRNRAVVPYPIRGCHSPKRPRSQYRRDQQ